jgi:RNA polymerase sigma-70 factor (ECF subfamily)
MTKAGEIVASKLEELHARYYKLLFHFARKLCKGARGIDPRDLVQETLVRFIDRPEGSLERGDGKPVDGWLIAVLTRYFYDQLRKVMSRQKAEDDPTITNWTLGQGDVPPTFERISPERFKWAIEQLPMKQRITILLKCDGLRNQDIANKLGVSEGVVATRLLNARRKLYELLKPYVDEELH